MRIIYLILFLTFISSVAIAYQNARPQISNVATSTGSSSDASKETANASETESSRGKMLYTNHCRACHESNVHIRENRRARSTADIIYWITRWSAHLELNWNTDDINEVEHYLEETYYKFDAKSGK